MKDNTLKLFIQNYQNEGMCKELPKFIKSFTKEFKKANTEKTINYYPWAVIERLFRMQGGKIEVVNWAEKIDFVSKDYVLADGGEMVLSEQSNSALFIRLKAYWQDEELEEFYPLFDNQNAKIIKTPDALDLNTARQRGSVRLISRISGIGLDIFEQQDSQFEGDTPENAGEKIVVKEIGEKKPDDKKETSTPKKTKKEIDKEAAQKAFEEATKIENKKPLEETTTEPTPMSHKKETQEQVDEVKHTEESTETSKGFLGGFLKGESFEPKKPQGKVEEPSETASKEEYDKDSEEHANVLLEVRKVVRNGNLQSKAKEFVKSKNKELLSELSYSELKELLDSLA